MDKKIIGLLILMSCITTTQAQIFKFGVKGGANISKIAGASFKEKFEYGYHLGGLIQIKVHKKLTLQPELLFSQINTTVDSSYNVLYNSIASNDYRKNISLKYLTIPLVVNYNVNRFVALQGGAQYGILMDSDKSLLSNGQSAFKNGDFAVLASIQFTLGKIMLGGRYVVGLNNINDIDNRDDWKSQTAQISVGLRF